MGAEGSRTEEVVRALSAHLTEPSVAVVGCGGAGTNIAHKIYWASPRVQTVAVNTDPAHLARSDAHKKVLFGRDLEPEEREGRGDTAARSVEKAREALHRTLEGYDLIFIVAGMGGATGSAAAPVVVSIANELNALSFAIPILPFSVEGTRRETALKAVERLREHAAVTIVLDNDKLLAVAPHASAQDALDIIDQSVLRIVESVCEQSSNYATGLLEDVASYAASLAAEEEATAPEGETASPPAQEELAPALHAIGTEQFESFPPSSRFPDMFG